MICFRRPGIFKKYTVWSLYHFTSAPIIIGPALCAMVLTIIFVTKNHKGKLKLAKVQKHEYSTINDGAEWINKL